MRESAATQAPTLPPKPPTATSVCTTPAGCSAGAERTGKEPCATCGTVLWTDAVFSNHTLYCSACAAEIRRTQELPPLPPTASQRRQLELWCQPHRGVSP
jgi:hypothetical protein